MVAGLGGPDDGAGGDAAGDVRGDEGGRGRRDVLPRDLLRRRRRRQAWTFAVLVTTVLVIGVAASGHWLRWWTIGNETSRAQATPCPQQRAIDPVLVTVNVYNATARVGLARGVAAELQARGFRVATITNDRSGQVVTGVAVVRHGAVGRLAAQTVAAQLVGQFTVVDDGRGDRTVDLVIGPAYAALKPRPEASKAIAPIPTPEGCVPVTQPA